MAALPKSDNLKTVLVTGGKRRLGAAICEALGNAGFRTIATSRAEGFPDFRTPGAAAQVAAMLAGEKIWGVVNNASVFDPSPAADAAALMQANAVFPEELILALAPESAVNILDADIFANPPETPYFLSKIALWRATRRLSRTLAPQTRVNAVAPGPVLAPENLHVKARPGTLERRATPADVAHAVCHLLAASYLTGQVLSV